MRLTRRRLLAATSALALGGPAVADPYVHPRNIRLGKGPPIAPVRPVTENLYGYKVTDRYRWMEAQGPEWLAYMKAQGDYTEAVLEKIPGRDALDAAIEKNSGDFAVVYSVQTGGEKIFSEIRTAGASLSRIFVRDGVAGTDRVLVDPQTFPAPAGTHQALDWWACSPDGSHLVFGISVGGSEQSVMHFMAADTGKLYPESMDRTAEASPSWLPDGSGIFYNRYQDVPPDSDAYEEDSICWFHKLGTDPASDIRILGKGLSASVAVDDIDSPFVAATPGSPLALGIIAPGVQNEISVYAAPLAGTATGRPEWRKICDPADDVTAAELRGEEIYLLTHRHASRYRVVKMTGDRPAFAEAVEVVPQNAAVIQGIAAARDGLYILDLEAGLSGLRRLSPEGAITRISLPFAGSIDMESFYADTAHDGAWFLLEGWVRPTVVCHVAPDGKVTQTDIAPPPPIDVSPYVSEEIFAVARDGTRIPLSLAYRKNAVKQDGTAPVLMMAYGSYGIVLNPFFLGRWLPFLDLGGVLATAHVRGGGELGEDWHIAGEKMQKFHTWQDTIDCGKFLAEARWTSHRRLGIWGGSAGGIAVGRAMTERPDFAAVVISAVGVSNPLREEFSPNGPPNIPEFGSVTTERGFLGLLAMDAYQHVHDGAQYPSVLLTTGLHDPRVPSWDPAKMAARLQAATASKNPVLLRVDADAGHGYGSTRKQRDSETADTIAFLMWRVGDPRFQPLP